LINHFSNLSSVLSAGDIKWFSFFLPSSLSHKQQGDCARDFRTVGAMSHWTWLFVDKLNGRCSLCDTVVGSAAPTNNANHLSAKHKISSDSPEVKAKQEERERSKSLVRIDVAIDKNRSEDMFLDFMLAYAEPYSRCEDELFRKAHPCAPASAKTLRERLLRHSARRLEEALAQLAGRWVTLAFDGGKIWSLRRVVRRTNRPCSGKAGQAQYLHRRLRGRQRCEHAEGNAFGRDAGTTLPCTQLAARRPNGVWK
jgi:hypothetical protein